MTARETVVLLDDDGTRTGTADKATVHSTDTPLHLAFSVHLLDDDGRVLVTRRALSKKTWPGVWTNSFCGHPAPDESFEDAIRRRAAFELGAQVMDIRVVAPDFRYRAVDASGIVENEICPVFTARVVGGLAPHPDEVMEVAWVDPEDLRRTIAAAPWALSPWLVEHADDVPLLREGVGV
ncbi:MAG: isopentenyl-diphosphate Delta-isomerase [Actinotalea sp.]|nr:isopentenyl-diphosphate Delta-isomerase [Actinotalea sp.]